MHAWVPKGDRGAGQASPLPWIPGAPPGEGGPAQTTKPTSDRFTPWTFRIRIKIEIGFDFVNGRFRVGLSSVLGDIWAMLVPIFGSSWRRNRYRVVLSSNK